MIVLLCFWVGARAQQAAKKAVKTPATTTAHPLTPTQVTAVINALVANAAIASLAPAVKGAKYFSIFLHFLRSYLLHQVDCSVESRRRRTENRGKKSTHSTVSCICSPRPMPPQKTQRERLFSFLNLNFCAQTCARQTCWRRPGHLRPSHRCVESQLKEPTAEPRTDPSCATTEPPSVRDCSLFSI